MVLKLSTERLAIFDRLSSDRVGFDLMVEFYGAKINPWQLRLT